MDIMEEITLKSDSNNLPVLLSSLNEFLEDYGASMKFKLLLELAVEELFVNICSYAYPDEGDVLIQWQLAEDPLRLIVSFIDNGVPFNPLEQDAPDLTLGVDEREIGGLGLTLVRKNVDDISYAYENNRNILTIEKKF